MQNLKFIIGFTLTGFFLSFFCGFLSHSNFLHIILNALLFSIIFAILAFVIQLLFDKFLDDGSSGETAYAGNGGVNSNTSDIGEAPVSTPTVGTKIDFVIQDEDLPVSESNNKFFVGDNHQLLNESDINPHNSSLNNSGNDKSEKNSNSEKEGFVPLFNGTTGKVENYDNLTEKEAGVAVSESNNNINNSSEMNKNIKTNNVSKNNTASSSNEGLDTLPDMNDVSFENNDSDESEDSGNDMTGYSGTSNNGSSKAGSDIGVDAKDASLLAKAISSILSGDS